MVGVRKVNCLFLDDGRRWWMIDDGCAPHSSLLDERVPPPARTHQLNQDGQGQPNSNSESASSVCRSRLRGSCSNNERLRTLARM